MSSRLMVDYVLDVFSRRNEMREISDVRSVLKDEWERL